MRISIGISGSKADQDVLTWCAQYARHGDRVKLVHVHSRLSAVQCGWLRAGRENAYRREQATELLADAEKDFVSSLGDLAIPTRTLAIGGVVADELTQEAHRDDILVVGAGHGEWPTFLHDITCPAVVVPAGWATDTRPGHDVAVLCGRELPVTAIDVAVEHARRTGMAVLVVHSSFLDDAGETTSHGADLTESTRAEQLDVQLASWGGPGGPPNVTEVRHGTLAEELSTFARTVGLAVLQIESGRTCDAGAGVAHAIRAVMGELKIPVLFVPTAVAESHPPKFPTDGSRKDTLSVVSA